MLVVSRCVHLGGIVAEEAGRPVFGCPVHRICRLSTAEACPDHARSGETIVEPIYDDGQLLPPPPEPSRSVGDCQFRGREIDQRVCELCGSRGVQIPVFECRQFGKCTLSLWQINQEEKCCLRCELGPWAEGS